MKAKFLIIIGIVLCAAMPLHIQAQEKKQESKTITEISSFTGTIINWRTNINHIYCIFSLKVGDKTYFVEFPTTLGSKIRSIGDKVTVEGTLNKKTNQIDFISIKGKGEIIYKADADKSISFSSFGEFKSGKGEITGIVVHLKGWGVEVDNNIVLRMPIQAAEQISQMYGKEEETIVEYTGMEMNYKKGEVAEKNYKIIYCHTITINGTQYLVR